MARKVVITGSASGMGKATAERLRAAGAQVVGVDLHDAEIVADLATKEGRERLVPAVRDLLGSAIDGLVVCAGVDDWNGRAVAVNYFGAVATLEALRPFLAKGVDPRAAVIASMGVAQNEDKALADVCLADDEPKAVALADERRSFAYPASKEAVAARVRQLAISKAWAGAGILLNAIAPGIILTPMGYRAIAKPQIVELFKGKIAQDRYGEPDEMARLLEFLISPGNSYMVGQLIYADGGVDAYFRPRHL
jgi:NAD(P)-dependent dehydrogenase (short-subunit alcohol dehydrogenase family)